MITVELTRILGRVHSPLIRSFSSSFVIHSAKSIKFLKSQRRKQLNEAKQNKIKNSLDSVDPVLGCKDTPFLVRTMAELKEPRVLSRDYQFDEMEKLLISIEAAKKEQLDLTGLQGVATELAEVDTEDLKTRRDAVLRILSMRNANNKDKMKMAIRLAREEFQRFPGDTGSSEVQAAIMTVRIQNIASHVQENKNDHKNTRALRILVQQRQSILRYLKKDKPDRYYWTIQKLGLSDNSVVSEFNMDRRYMQEYNFFGDRVLVKDSKKVANEKRKAIRKERKLSKLTKSS